MARLDHTKANARDRILRNGVDDLTDMGVPAGLAPPRQHTSKASQRQALADATASAPVTRLLRCRRCGHTAAVPVTAAMRGRRFRCCRCGEVTS